MASSFPRLLAAWLGIRVANRKKVRWQSIATHQSGGLSPFRGHSSALNACVQSTRTGASDKPDARENGLSCQPHRCQETEHPRVSPSRRLAQHVADRQSSPCTGPKVLTVSCRPDYWGRIGRPPLLGKVRSTFHSLLFSFSRFGCVGASISTLLIFQESYQRIANGSDFLARSTGLRLDCHP